jgi:signal transduction histidine kinase
VTGAFRFASRIWGSLAGRLALLLTTGMALVTTVALLVAQEAHRETLAHLRMESVVGTTEDIASRLAARPEATEGLLAAGLVRDVRVPPRADRIVTPSPKITTLLHSRLGAQAGASGQVRPHDYCFPPGSANEGGGLHILWPAIPDCWLITFTDTRHVPRALAIRLPRYLSGASDIIDPIYLTLIVVMSAVLATLVAYLAIKPLRQLTKAAEAFSLVEEPVLIPETGPRELRNAIATFNLMQRRVSEGHRERTGMLAAISHDLQTPLTRLQLRLDDVADPAVRARLSADLAAMQAIVREGLELARSSDNREPWSIVDIDSLLASIAEDAAEMGAEVDVRRTCGLAIPTKIDAMTRCVTNLVENAVKYGGSAAIECVASPHRLLIRICDDGPGIEESQREHMFEPFVRGEQSRSRATGGTGLGLTIARAQAKLFRGEVSLENRDGGGTVAIISIALKGLPAGV